MKKQPIIISIGRQFGSGGMNIGKALAKELGFDYYDKELITLVAKESGFNPELFESADEKPPRNLLFQWLDGVFSGGYHYDNYLSNDTLFKMQSDVIRKLAEEKSCVIVGRCSDYVLRENPNCVSIFLHSSMEDRIERVCRRQEMEKEEAMEIIKLADKRRASYYNYYSSKTWGETRTYTLSIDVSSLGESGTVDFIRAVLKMKFALALH
jgi:cytidylate kinase